MTHSIEPITIVCGLIIGSAVFFAVAFRIMWTCLRNAEPMEENISEWIEQQSLRSVYRVISRGPTRCYWVSRSGAEEIKV
jgi:hypothetical protein